MKVLPGQPDAGRHAVGEPRRAPRQAAASWRWTAWLEGTGVVASPGLAALVLRLRLMAPIDLSDPTLHTTYIIDPRDVFVRYAAAYASTARLRESARVGFLVPARLSYELFGAVPGFLVFRYLLALTAVVPVYLLLRRLYGPPAGVSGILIVLASPVFVTAWGTDFPDSAVISYAAAGLACLAMPCSPRWRRAWLAASGAAMTAAVWSFGVSVLLAGATLLAWLAVRLLRQRRGLAGDIAVLAGAAAAVTGILAGASAVVLGHADYLTLTWQSLRFLERPDQIAHNHSANWHWVMYVTYLLVPPAALAALAVTFWRRRRPVPAPVLVIGAAAAAQLLAYIGGQFVSTIQSLEQMFFSSTLWAGVCLVVALVVAEMSRPLSGHPVLRWLPPALLLAVPLAYEADAHVPALGMKLAGLTGLALVGAAVAGRAAGRLRASALAATGAGLAVTVLAGAALILTVAPLPAHPPLPDTASADDPAPAYGNALGGSAAAYIANYQIAAELPGFVGAATYSGEQLLTWKPHRHAFPYREYGGMYHDGFNSLPQGPPHLTQGDRRLLDERRPAEILLLDSSAASFPAALRSLADYRPVLIRSAVLRSKPLVLHVWLIRLDRYYHEPGRSPAGERASLSSYRRPAIADRAPLPSS